MNLEIVQNIYLIGPMGAGKTSIGKQLARKLHLKFYDSDHVIEEQTGATIPWIYDIEGESGFQQREIKVISELTKLKGILLATGGGTVALLQNRQALTESQGIIIYLKTSLEGQIERVKYSKKRPIITGDERIPFLKKIRAQSEPFYEQLANISYNTDNKSLHLVVNDLLHILIKEFKC